MNLFDFHVPEQVLVALSLLILVVVLRRFFWNPVMKIIEDRQKGVDDMLSSTEEAKAQIAQMEETCSNQNAQLDKLISDKTQEARLSAEREQTRIIKEAREKANEIVSAAQDKAKREYDQTMSDSREAIIALAMGAASKVVESSMDTKKNRELIETILSDAGVNDG